MRQIADLAHAHGALFYADAVQAVGMVMASMSAPLGGRGVLRLYKWLIWRNSASPVFASRGWSKKFNRTAWQSFL